MKQSKRGKPIKIPADFDTAIGSLLAVQRKPRTRGKKKALRKKSKK